MTENTPIGVGCPAVPVETAVLATGWPSANSVARCLSMDTTTCSGPEGIGDLSAARPALPSAFSAALERALTDFPAGGLDAATPRELNHQVSGFGAAWTCADPAINSAA